MIKQAEILKHDADSAPQHGQTVTIGKIDIFTEDADNSPVRLLRQIHHAQQRSFSGAALTGQKMEGPFFKRQFNIA